MGYRSLEYPDFVTLHPVYSLGLNCIGMNCWLIGSLPSVTKNPTK